MKNSTIKLKVKQRVNKLASNDYDNIQDWQIIEAFNKGVVGWCRRTIVGTNLSKTGDEGSKRRIDDLQVLITHLPISMNRTKEFYESDLLPKDYFEWKRVSAKAIHNCCKDPRPLTIYLGKEADVDTMLKDNNLRPDFEWAETFCTLAGNKLKIYTSDRFEVVDPVLTYYKQPRRIEMIGVSDPYTGTVSLEEVECEFKDDLVELFIDECVKILAGDIESMNAQQLADNSVETNN